MKPINKFIRKTYITLPIDLGEAVYFIPHDTIIETVVTGYRYTDKGLYMMLRGYGSYPVELIGKLLFKTKKTAKAKLLKKKREERKC